MAKSHPRAPRGVTLWIKMLSAAVGAGVVIATGVLTVAGGNEAHADDKGIAGSTMTTAPSTPATAKAVPTLKAPPWKCSYCH